jgi:hypothetical protein
MFRSKYSAKITVVSHEYWIKQYLLHKDEIKNRELSVLRNDYVIRETQRERFFRRFKKGTH